MENKSECKNCNLGNCKVHLYKVNSETFKELKYEVKVVGLGKICEECNHGLCTEFINCHNTECECFFRPYSWCFDQLLPSKEEKESFTPPVSKDWELIDGESPIGKEILKQTKEMWERMAIAQEHNKMREKVEKSFNPYEGSENMYKIGYFAAKKEILDYLTPNNE